MLKGSYRFDNAELVAKQLKQEIMQYLYGDILAAINTAEHEIALLPQQYSTVLASKIMAALQDKVRVVRV